MQVVTQSAQDHALVMRHVGAHDLKTVVVTGSRACEVQGFIQAETAQRPQAHQVIEIIHDGLRVYGYCQHGCVRRDDKVFAQTTLQSKYGYSESLVLILQMRVKAVIA